MASIYTVLNGKCDAPLAKIVELSDNYAIHGQIYDKYSLAPDAMSFLHVKATPDCEVVCNNYRRVPNTTGNSGGNFSEKSVIRDNINKDIEYLITPCTTPVAATGVQPIVCVIKNNDGTYTKKWVTSNASTGNSDYRYIGQDASYLYLLLRHTNDTDSVMKILKSDGTYTLLGLSSTYRTEMRNFLPEIVEGCIYFTSVVYSSGAFKIQKINTSDLTITTTKTSTAVPALGYGHFMSVVPFRKGRQIISYTIDGNKVNRFIYDIDTDILTESTNIFQLPVTPYLAPNGTDGDILGTVPIFNGQKLIITHRMDKYSTTAVKDKQIMMLTINQDNFDLSDCVVYKNDNPHRTHLINADDNLMYLVGLNTIDVIGISSVGTANALTKMISLPSYDISLFGVDLLNNVMVQTTDSCVYLLNSKIPVSVEVIFANISGGYKGVNIDSTVTIKVKNHIGASVAAKLQLELAGNAIFTSDGLKSKTITTSGETTLPITYTGKGLVNLGVNIV